MSDEKAKDDGTIPSPDGATGERWLDVAFEIADGQTSDWDGLRSDLPREQEMLRSLRLLADLGALHREAALPEADLLRVIEGPGQVSGGASATETSRDNAHGLDRWGDLVLLERIGAGTSSEVYRARDTKLDRIVAAKILRNEDGVAGGDFARTILEARRLAAVRHPNVVTVHFADSIDGRSGICMEYLKGATLEMLLAERGPFGPAEIVSLGESLCGGLAAIHAAGLVHQDVKTENVLREEGGRIVLMDLGVGGGTPLFVAPEAMEGRALDARSDLYSLGVVLYRLATGAFPIEGQTIEEIRSAHRRSARIPLRDRRPDFPTQLARVIEDALSTEPRSRVSSAGEMERALHDALVRSPATHLTHEIGDAGNATPYARSGSSPAGLGRSRTRTRWIAAATVLATLAVAVLFVSFRDRGEDPTFDVPKAGTGAPYTVHAHVQRGSKPEPLHANAQLALGDSLSMHFEASESLYVYVLNRDEAGHAYLVFPLAGLDVRNPLPPHPQRLPGSRHGRPFFWQVNTAGGREELLVVASRERLVGLESEALALARPDENAPIEYPSLDVPITGLRGLGGIVGGVDPAAPARPVELFDTAGALSENEEKAQGVWMRKVAFRGPVSDR